MMQGLELKDFIEYVDKPLQMLHVTKCFVDKIDNEDWQQVLVESKAVSTAFLSIKNPSEDTLNDDVDKLLLAASQQFELQSESHQPSLQQVSDASTVLAEVLALSDEIDNELLLAASQQFEDQFCKISLPHEAMCEGLKVDSTRGVLPAVPCNS